MAEPPTLSEFPIGGGAGSPTDTLSAMLARNWWAVGLRGLLAILFGVAAVLLPFVTLASLAVLLGVYLLVDGGLAIAAGFRAAAHHERWGLLIMEGIVDLVAGVAAFALPGLTVLVLVVLLGVWSIISGALLLVASFRLHGGHGRWILALSGLVSIVWGGLLYMSPVAGALVLAWWLGGYALVFGVLLLILAFRLRSRRVTV